MIGRVHSIDTFSTLDGPGIRTVIFMQGCHLRCKYCHNPDTWNPNALTAREYTVDKIMKIIYRCIPYFRASGGGVTFSGGEPLLQHDFIREVFQQCKKHQIHTAFDTSLYVSTVKVEELLPFTDLVLADIKQMNPVKSRVLTGLDNELNLSNLKLINKSKVEIWIRYVIIPGVTDEDSDIKAMTDFIISLENVTRIDLLSYHSLGSHKWPLLGLEYELKNISPPEPSKMEELKYLIESRVNKPVFIS